MSMELKVWVDGIQRVVCGASYSTTCQDVVIALASAMGQTGRFTLVEKWRDSERPLFPGEYPLQALYKWGEYAGEVRFYLMQAAADNVKQKEIQHKREAQIHSLQVSNKYSTPQLSENRLNSPETESLRRSSTFSGAHRTNYTPVLSTAVVTSSSHQSAALFNSKNGQQKTVQSSVALARGRPAGVSAVTNGEVSSVSDSSSKIPSKLLPSVPRTIVSGGPPSGLQPPVRRDGRQLHPANMPTSYSSTFRDYPPDSSLKPFVSSSAQRPSAQNQRYSQKIPSSSNYETPSAYKMLNPPTSQSFPTPQGQHSLSSQQFQSKGNVLQLQQQQQRKPFSQFHILPSSSENERIPPDSKPRQEPPQPRDRSQERQAQMSQSATLLPHPHYPSKPMLNSNRTEATQIDTSVRGHRYDNAVYSDINIARNINQSVRDDRLSHRVMNSSGPQDSSISKGSSHPHYHKRTDLGQSATLDRHKAPSTVSDLPIRSYSTGDSSQDHLKHSHQGQADNLQQHSAVSQQHSTVGQQQSNVSQQHSTVSQQHSTVGQQKPAAVGNRLTFVESALMKPQKPGTHGYNPKTSSFSSAVAHIRSQGDTIIHNTSLHNSLTGNGHSKQHVLNNLREDNTSERNRQNSTLAVNSQHVLGEINHRTDTAGTDHQLNLQPLQFGNKPSVPFSSISSSSQQPSAFSPVSPKPSHQESKFPFAYNLNSVDTSSDNNQIHDLSNSSQTSLEIEEYDLERNFPDMHHREAASNWTAAEVHRPAMYRTYNLEDGVMLNQADREYTRLLRIVGVQQERIKTQEALISDASMEISLLEEEESSKMAQLEMFAKDISHMEKQEVELQEKLEELERGDWASVQENEQKREEDINLQMKSLKEGLEKLEWQIKQCTEQADHISKEVRAEEEQIKDRRRKTEELEKKIILEMARLKDQLAGINKTMDDNGKKDVENQILEADIQLKQQEEKVNSLTEKLKEQDLISSGSTPVPGEVSRSSAGGIDTQVSVNTMSTTDSGEAILKILEGRLSPRSPENSGDGYDNISSAQHVYKSAMSIKNPNGVWV